MCLDLVYRYLRPLLFCLPPEMAHQVVLRSLGWLPQRVLPNISGSGVQALGLTFPHRVGLAAGFDKTGQYAAALSRLSFAFIEVGTITPLPQAGSSKPRLFRLTPDEALINRMGFNNAGLTQTLQSLKNNPPHCLLGLNIGKQKETPLSQAVDDYRQGLSAVYPIADYVTMNISSPNTPDLRRLQEADFLETLLQAVVETRKRLADQYQRQVPLVLKCSPDEDDQTLATLADKVLHFGIEGIIATNTSVARPHLRSPYAKETGGLSGRPLFERSTAVLRQLKSRVGDAVSLIASGGIMDETSAAAKIEAGATLLQLYTGLIYQGPGLIERISRVCPH